MTENMQAVIDRSIREAFSERSRKAGLVGGPARAAKLSPRRRRQIAKKAAAARWGNRKDAA